jgi:hypothetical protein
MFKLKPAFSPSEKDVALDILKKELICLKRKISVVRDFEIGVNITDNPSAYDILLNFTFDSPADLQAYSVHPDHQAFIAFNKDYSESKAVLDYLV